MEKKPMVVVGPETTQEQIQELIGLGYTIVFEVDEKEEE